ncbi:hypothetical protein [Arcticibacter eurypsychrophilus]|uniref:hypothetical protein n=1 Tax=Arcticibacter eurypsychrophilus TaxID=1434752 RepID=UPI00084DD9CC|nr:hypothetical protein [Arcticibacter eurypsychrophilus]
MSIKPLSILEPLVNDLHGVHIGYFLKTNQFSKFMIRENLHIIWSQVYEQAVNDRTFFSFDMDHEPFDRQDALTLLLNLVYNQNRNLFFSLTYKIIELFNAWNNKSEQLPFDEVIDDFQLLEFPKEYIDGLNNLRNFGTSAVPLSVLPESIWNASKLKESLDKMDTAIKNGNFNLTLTYAYSCLEGIFKAFIVAKIPEKADLDKLNQLAVAVRDFLKNDFDQKGIKYPEGVLTLIPTITNAISNARNGHSESHFDNEADKWLAEFSRDCVNSICRLVMKFI